MKTPPELKQLWTPFILAVNLLLVFLWILELNSVPVSLAANGANRIERTISSTRLLCDELDSGELARDLPVGGLNLINSSPTFLGSKTCFTASLEEGSGEVIFTWDFGDGQTGLGQDAAHIYQAVGTYTVIGTATNSVNLVTATTLVTLVNPPLAIPETGGVITPTPGVTISASSAVFSGTVLMNYESQPVTSTGTLSQVGLFYKISATHLLSGLPVQPLPGKRYTITVTYQQEDIPFAADESNLALYTWNGTAWVKEPSSIVDVGANTISATPKHFSLWAALSNKPLVAAYQVFLPIIVSQGN